MKTLKTLIPVLFIIVSVLFGTSCMTSKGSLFEDTAASDSLTSSDEEEDEVEENPGLTINTDPSYAEVYIDDSYAGISPVTEYPKSGNYRITVTAEGYYTTTEWVNYTKGDDVSLTIYLNPITGFLNISLSPEEAEISTGWDELDEGINEIQIGTYIVRAEIFGYEPWEKQVNIFENNTTFLNIEMEPSDFKLSNLFLNRRAFNPANPSGLGESKFFFNVSTYGTGELIIFSNNGESILTNTFSYFDKSNQSFVWKGKDNYGNLMPDGTYRVVISGRDMDGNNPSQKEIFITIDSSLVIRIRTTLNGTSGTMFCPSPDTLPLDSFQMSVSSFGHIKDDTYRFPFTLSTRFIPVSNLEIIGQAGIVVLPETSESYFFSGSVKSIIFDTKIGDMSWYIKGSYQNNHQTDSQTNFTGLSAGLPMSVSFLPLTLVITPEIILSPFRISYDSTEYNIGFNYWGYGRAALIFDMDPIMLGLSTAIRVTPYYLGISSNNP
ncbi:MAG: PEGA domain-containing protein, partial [Spirochaetales bacterium]|nr:PEGA domain-containing protein [Spirochaetales bacterium]